MVIKMVKAMPPSREQAIERQKEQNIMVYGKIDTSNPLFLMPKGGIIRDNRVNEERKQSETICLRYIIIKPKERIVRIQNVGFI